MKKFLATYLFLGLIFGANLAAEEGFVAILKMDMLILPGTASYLEQGIDVAEKDGAKAIVVLLDTPGGMLDTSQQMIQAIFRSKIPVIMYVSPSGATATSAGVFITMAAHVAAMAPGTTIGAAHPVSGEGKDLEKDMRAKAENMTVAMVESIAQQRGRNIEWAKKSVRESNSITEAEALKSSVVDVVGGSIDEVLKAVSGKEVKLGENRVKLGDYSKLPKRYLDMGFKDRGLNVLAHPNVAALLWLAASTGISIELYNPGLILPGVVGVICLVLAMAVSQIIPVNFGAVALLVLGTLMLASELFVTSGILALGGVIAIIMGSIYFIDTAQAPGLSVALQYILIPVALAGIALFLVGRQILTSMRKKFTTGYEGLLGQHGRATETVALKGRVFVNGEIWNAVSQEGIIEKESQVEVVRIVDSMTLEVKKI